MSQIKQAEMRLSVSIQEGYELLDEFKYKYKKFADLLPDLPPSMKSEKAEIVKLMQELAAHSRELKQEIKSANSVISHITGHVAWKKAIVACFGEDGLAKCYEYFESNREHT